MDYQSLSSVNGQVISVTTTATPLLSLINTAAGAAQALPEGLNAVDLHVESGSVRISFSNVPTASKGMLLNQGIYQFRNVNLAALQLISATGSAVPVSVAIGMCAPDEVGIATSESDAASAGTIQTAGADGQGNTVNMQSVDSRLSGFNGTTWDRIRAGITGVVSSVVGFLNSLTYGQYNSTPPTFTNGQYGPLQQDSSGRLITNPAPLTPSADQVGVQGIMTEQSGLSTAATSGNFLVASIDVSTYKHWCLQILGTWTGTLVWEGSNDNATWQSVFAVNVDNPIGIVSSATTNKLVQGPVLFHYFRVRVSVTGTGTVQGVLDLFTVPPPLVVTQVAATGTGGSGSTPSNIIVVGGRAANASPTAVSNNQVSYFMTDLLGKQVVMPYSNPENITGNQAAAITDTSSHQVLPAAGASVRNYVTGFLVTNTHASVGTRVDILDGATVKASVYVGPTTQANTSIFVPLPSPIVGTANTAVNAQCGTTGANVFVACFGYTAP